MKKSETPIAEHLSSPRLYDWHLQYMVSVHFHLNWKFRLLLLAGDEKPVRRESGLAHVRQWMPSGSPVHGGKLEEGDQARQQPPSPHVRSARLSLLLPSSLEDFPALCLSLFVSSKYGRRFGWRNAALQTRCCTSVHLDPVPMHEKAEAGMRHVESWKAEGLQSKWGPTWRSKKDSLHSQEQMWTNVLFQRMSPSSNLLVANCQ